MSGYVNPKYSQGDGSKYQWVNCGCAVMTDLIDKATCGALRIQAPVIRKATGDTSGGVTDSVLIDTVWRLTKNTPYPVRLIARAVDRSKVDDIAESGRVFGGSIWTGVSHNTRFETNDYIGGHKLYTADHDPGFYFNDDPGTTAAGYMYWPSDLYYRAMEVRGGGKCILIVAPDTEDVDVECVMKGRFRATPSVNGKDMGPLPVGRVRHSTKTVNGGPWVRRDGGVSYGWWKFAPGLYAAGERWRRAA